MDMYFGHEVLATKARQLVIEMQGLEEVQQRWKMERGERKRRQLENEEEQQRVQAQNRTRKITHKFDRELDLLTLTIQI